MCCVDVSKNDNYSECSEYVPHSDHIYSSLIFREDWPPQIESIVDLGYCFWAAFQIKSAIALADSNENSTVNAL